MSQIRHLPVAPTLTRSGAAGEVVSRHRHDEHQLVHVSAGVIAITTARGSWVASPGRAAWIPAGTWHEHRFYGASSFHTVGFPPSDPPLPGGSPCVVAVDTLLRELIVAVSGGGVDADEADRLRGVLRDRLRRAELRPLTLPAPRDPRLAEACGIVEADLAHPQPLAALARTVNTAERTLARLFRRELGCTYPQWRTQVRVFHAMVLLAGGGEVTATAHACGWASASAFIDTFARTMGQTPGAYRAAARA
jgi:AraC-like DNA-binding protein